MEKSANEDYILIHKRDSELYHI